ncbi:hypothetical protein HY498_03350 [Candidatus Woesearchaeota archaeon]|nr:hypothetical protein [Candidatus Woesearchaeota archaeon]
MVFVMHNIYYFLNLISIIVAAVIAYYGYKAYKFTNEKKYAFFGLSFLLQVIGYVILITAFIVHKTTQYFFPEAVPELIKNIVPLYHSIYGVYILFTLTAYTLFILIYSEIKERPHLTLIGFLILALMYPAYHSFRFFNAVAIGLILFILYYQITAYREKKELNKMLVIIAFFLFLLSHAVLFLFGPTVTMIALAYGIQLISFLLFAAIVLRIETKWQQKEDQK